MAWRLGKSSALHAAAGPSSDTTQQPPLPFVTRDYYLEHPAVAALTEQQVEAERKRLGVVVHGEDVPKPVGSFVQASLPEHVLGTLRAAGYDAPTPIQRQAWPIAMSGRDVVGLAETGSGKTLAYLLPALVHASAQPPLKEGEGPLCLVLAPTRELACQIESEARDSRETAEIQPRSSRDPAEIQPRVAEIQPRGTAERYSRGREPSCNRAQRCPSEVEASLL